LWETPWLASRWGDLMGRLGRMGFGPEAGLLRVARPVSVEPGLIRLSYAAAQEPIRRQAAGAMAGRVAKAMGALASGEVRCEFVTTDEPAEPAATAGRAITSEQKKKVAEDPAVAAVKDLFGGEIVSIQPNPSVQQATDDGADGS